MTDVVDGFYKKTPTPATFAFCNFLSFTIASMSADSELEKLVREFEQEGLPHLFNHPPVSVTREEIPLAPTQPMQTRSTRKKFKPEVRSKRNKDRHQQSGKTLEDPSMNPSGSAEVPFEEDENIAPQHPPYLPPVRPGVQLPRWMKKFTLHTPSLPPGVQLVRTMTGKVD